MVEIKTHRHTIRGDDHRGHRRSDRLQAVRWQVLRCRHRRNFPVSQPPGAWMHVQKTDNKAIQPVLTIGASRTRA